ncbi:unnamed protein product (macronuclear) [Paramecium tetraurelia]|uniref:Uncharacterized protein n=1 Tax=Paramecium tetraurelia TaxID=5888 RepID=A0EBC0_PARTE|nr:uncharacterized protein GSPATT00025321001 [Paramecium tetraurelia]CAK92587.1 unnamed protein product [Paramecium tetraurelia]|eukprot:XP_001459984.1 hypothetical protein (macronuclear) [Paramecium tetraurelia strain d4-2]
MPTPERKKNKKKEKASSHRSSQKRKSKKKKSSRTSSRNRDRKTYKRDNKASNLGMQIFGQDIMKKLQEFNNGKRTEDLMAMSLLPYMKTSSINSEANVVEQKQQKDKKSMQKQRLLIPINYDTLMIIIDEPFYKEHLSEEMINFMKKKLISSMKRQVIDQKSDNFLSKIDKLEQDLTKKGDVEELENQIQLGVVNSIFSVLNNNKELGDNLDPAIKDIFQMMEIEKPDIIQDDIYFEAKQMFS